MTTARKRGLGTAAVILALISTSAYAQPVADHAPAPINLHAEATGSNVVITWRAGGVSTPDGFRLEAGSAPGLADLAIVNIPWNPAWGGDAQFTAAGVAPGVYYLRVRAVSGAAVGTASEETVMRVGTSSCAMPNAPRNVNASVASEVVTLAWEQPGGGADASGYVIEAGSRPGAPNIAIITISETTHLSLSAPPGRYFVRLRAMGLCGASEPSRELEVIVP